MPPVPHLRITHHDGPQTLQLKAEVLGTYLDAHLDQQHDPWATPDRFWERLVDLYAPSKDFAMTAGWLGDDLIGYAFGSVREDGASIWAAVADALPDLVIPVPPTGVYIFREFAVRSAHQQHGYGHQIHDALLDSRSEQLAHLLVRTDNERARRAYLAWGWRKIGELRPFEDSPLMEQMVIALPVEATA
jgi:GNAT superfamily N-acetyltransferase